MCDNPAPLYGGLECAGDDTEYVNCSADECKGKMFNKLKIDPTRMTNS